MSTRFQRLPEEAVPVASDGRTVGNVLVAVDKWCRLNNRYGPQKGKSMCTRGFAGLSTCPINRQTTRLPSGFPS